MTNPTVPTLHRVYFTVTEERHVDIEASDPTEARQKFDDTYDHNALSGSGSHDAMEAETTLDVGPSVSVSFIEEN